MLKWRRKRKLTWDKKCIGRGWSSSKSFGWKPRANEQLYSFSDFCGRRRHHFQIDEPIDQTEMPRSEGDAFARGDGAGVLAAAVDVHLDVERLGFHRSAGFEEGVVE